MVQFLTIPSSKMEGKFELGLGGKRGFTAGNNMKGSPRFMGGQWWPVLREGSLHVFNDLERIQRALFAWSFELNDLFPTICGFDGYIAIRQEFQIKGIWTPAGDGWYFRRLKDFLGKLADGGLGIAAAMNAFGVQELGRFDLRIIGYLAISLPKANFLSASVASSDFLFPAFAATLLRRLLPTLAAVRARSGNIEIDFL